MGKNLHKLGVFAFRHAWWFVAGWVIVIAVLGFAASKLMLPTSNAISIPGTEAQVAIDRMNELFPSSGKGSGQIVFKAEDGKKISDYSTTINQLVTDVKAVDGVSNAINPLEVSQLVSDDGTIAYTVVQLDDEVGSTPTATFDGVNDVVDTARKSGLEVEMAGGLIDQAPGEILGIGEIAGVVLALIVLVMTLASLIAAGMPIVVAIVGVAVSTAGLFSLSHVVDISNTTPVLGVMLGLAVGIDYSLFIISKYRALLLEGHTPESAAGRALGTAGNAVIFAATTVVIALAALSIVNIPFMTTMGLAGAGSIAVAAIVAVTLIPAMLGIAGLRIFGRKTRAKAVAAQKAGVIEHGSANHATIWYKWGAGLTKYPWLALVASVAVVAAIAWPMQYLQMGLPTDEYAAKSSTQRRAYDLITEGFGVGYNGRIVVLAENLPSVSEVDKQAVRTQAEAELQKQVATATAEQQQYFAAKAAAATTTYTEQMELQQEIAAAQAQGEAQKAAAQAQIEQAVAQYAKYVQLQKIADRIAKIDGVEATSPVQVLDDGTAGIVQVVPTTSPSDPKTIDLIHTLRDSDEQATLRGDTSAKLSVTGSTALQADINAKLAAALPEYLAVVVGLSFLLLVLVFRSILVPLKATLGFLLSVAAMFGAMVMVFQWGWLGLTDSPGPIVSFIPIIAIGVLFGLAMDYEFFLVSGMRETFVHTDDAKRAVVQGFGLGSKVVTAAGVIMVSIFAGFITNGDSTIQTIGFGLAVGILVDAFIVRMTLVPAVMTLLDRAAWWLPRWLDKLLPHVSIEGEDDK